jgi:hypothetical protein
MPIHKMSCDDGIFSAKTVGYVDNVDGRMWSNALKNYAKIDMYVLSAVIDMVEVNRICPTVIKAIAEAARIPNIGAIALVIDSSMSSQNARAVEKLADLPNVRVFFSFEEARRYANSRLTASVGSSAFAGMSMTRAFSYGYAFALR